MKKMQKNQMSGRPDEIKYVKREKRKKWISKSFTVGIGIFLFMAVVIKLFLGCDTWKSYAFLDAIVGGITIYLVNSGVIVDGDELIAIGLKIFFITAFLLGIVLHFEAWLSFSVHVGITFILIGALFKEGN